MAIGEVSIRPEMESQEHFLWGRGLYINETDYVHEKITFILNSAFFIAFCGEPNFSLPFQRKAHKVFQEISRLSTTFSATNSARMRNQANSQKWPRKFERYSQNRRKSNPSSHSPSKHTNERWIKQDGCFSADVKQSHKRCGGKKSYGSLNAPSMERRSFSRTSERQGMKLQVLLSALRPSPWQVSTSFLRSL